MRGCVGLLGSLRVCEGSRLSQRTIIPTARQDVIRLLAAAAGHHGSGGGWLNGAAPTIATLSTLWLVSRSCLQPSPCTSPTPSCSCTHTQAHLQIHTHTQPVECCISPHPQHLPSPSHPHPLPPHGPKCFNSRSSPPSCGAQSCMARCLLPQLPSPTPPTPLPLPPCPQVFYKKIIATKLWGSVMTQSFFPAYCAIVLVAAAAAQHLFLVRRSAGGREPGLHTIGSLAVPESAYHTPLAASTLPRGQDHPANAMQ